MDIEAKAREIVNSFQEIQKKLEKPEIATNPDQFVSLSREKSSIQDLYDLANPFLLFKKELYDLESISEEDPDMIELIESEKEKLAAKIEKTEEQLVKKLLLDDPNDNKNAIVEIRAGTGGDEAGLFAADLFRMYSRFAEIKGLKVSVVDSNETGVGGIKSITFNVEGIKAYGMLKYEGGVHRVQRIPKTESGGRVHTSAATVAILPEAETADVDLNEADLKIDTYRASGAGGQHVNKTESAIRITHIPTGIVVTCQDESSQHKNKASAMKVLRARLYSLEVEKINRERDDMRKSLVSTGDRSAKIRTYNFPQGRITDHRINFTTHQLQSILDGSLDDIIGELRLADESSRLA